MRQERISMRALAEYSLLKGDLRPEGANAARMREGIVNHQVLQSLYEGDMRPEVPLEITVATNTCELTVTGRADGLLIADEYVIVEEIKTAPGRVLKDDYPVHWAQAEGYAYMACRAHNLARATVRLVYVHSASSGASTRFEREFDIESLEKDFRALLKPYANRLDSLVRFQNVRDSSIHDMKFPFGIYRTGQRRMAVSAYRALRDGYDLLVQAPTGTGKTVGALFPALKALGDGHIERIMYLTARRTTRNAAWDCIKLLKGGGLRARVCVITAKEQICLMPPGTRCMPESCPYCVGYFDKRRAALDDARDNTDYDYDFIRTLAQKYGICPFELSLDMSEMSDVIICDYNYVFDPNVYLRRFFISKSRIGLLIDEAHNLVSRAREMLSCSISFDDYVRLYRRLSAQTGGDSHECRQLVKFMTVWRTFGEGHMQAEFDNERPDALIKACQELTDTTSPSLNMQLECAGEWAERWFGLLNFSRVGAMYNGENYATVYEAHDRAVNVTQLCVDATEHIRRCLKKVRATVMFSATLMPMKYYFSALGLDEDEGDAMLELPSPFLSENFLIRRLPVATRYSQRPSTLAQIADIIGIMASAHAGNYIVCFPSYAYLRAAASEFSRRHGDVKVIQQRPAMTDRQRAEFLASFKASPEKSMVAFITMGGVFSESIDLPGERLSGAAIVGVGLPQICPEREALRAHFDKKLGEGMNYAYVYPGICKVLQAAGRVIRTEDDAGIALLLDERFFREPYSELFPAHWHVGDAWVEDLERLLKKFWRGEMY